MQGDQLLQEWKDAKEICHKIIDISIKANLFQIVQGKQNAKQFMKVYDVVYRLCSNRQTEETRVLMAYRDYKDMLKGSLLTMAKELNKERDICKMRVLRKIWEAYGDILKRLKHMFAYLNRDFHIKQAKIEDLDRTGMVLLVTTFFTEESLNQYETTYFRHLIKIRKSFDLADSQVLKDYVDILYRIHARLVKNETKRARTLFTDFTQKYLNDAKHYYQEHFKKLKQFSPSEYFIEVNRIYEQEQRIVFECFGINSDNLLHKDFSAELLEKYREMLIHSPKGLKSILHNREASTINIITQLYKKLTNSIDGFREPFETFIEDQFVFLISEVRVELMMKKSQSIYISFIQKIIKMSNQLAEVLETSFMKHTKFKSYFKNGAERAFSRNQLQVPVEEMLVIYIEMKFKTTFANEDEQVEETRNIINVFMFLENKDLFLIKYLQRLSRRILLLSIEGLANHEHFVYQLKKQTDNKFTEKIETIIDEYKVSVENDEEYRVVCTKNNLPYNMKLKVFSEGQWPYPDIVSFTSQQLSAAMEQGVKCLHIYQEEFIKKKTLKISFLDSRVRWLYHFDESVNNKNTHCDFYTNGVQAVLLMYIYQHRPERVSLKLLEHLYPHIKPSLMRNLLDQMVECGENILMRTVLADNEEKEAENFYEFNGLMKSKKRIIQYDVNAEAMEEEEKQLFQKNELGRDRDFTLDANIAKLMKSKKILNFETIVEEIIKMVKVFTPSQKDIKLSVDRLLVKELLCRDERDKRILKYKD